MKKQLLVSGISLVLMGFSYCATAQQQKAPVKGSYVDSLNRYYQQAELPVYIYISTSPDKAPTQLKEATAATPQPMYLDGHGVHNLRHVDHETKRAENFQIYADGIAPKTTIKFTGAPTYKSGSKTFYGKGLTVSIQATDEMSGVKDVLYSLNGTEYAAYHRPLAILQDGGYTYQYYAVDNVGNMETVKTASFTVDVTAPKTYYRMVGITDDKVISLTSQLSLRAEDSLSGVAATYYSFDGEPFKKCLTSQVPITQLTNGEHTLTFYSVDNLRNKEENQSMTFFLDRTAPIMSVDILGDRFIVDDKVYFSGKTKMKLTAIDNRSGVEEVRYSINGAPFQKYTEPFYLPSKAGKYEVRYYALDKVGNNTGEDKITHSSGIVYVDLTGPVISNSFDGSTFKKGDVTYINSKTLNKLSATDTESGLQRLAYVLDTGEEKPYSRPFTVLQEGLHKIAVAGYDNVNNRNEKTYSIFVDNAGPEVGYSFSTKPSLTEGTTDVHPSYTTLFLNAIDDATTVSSIAYTINDNQEQLYASPIKGFAKQQTYTVRVKAKDALGNETVKVFVFKTNDL